MNLKKLNILKKITWPNDRQEQILLNLKKHIEKFGEKISFKSGEERYYISKKAASFHLDERQAALGNAISPMTTKSKNSKTEDQIL